MALDIFERLTNNFLKIDVFGALRAALRDASGNPTPQDRAPLPATQGAMPLTLSDDGIARILRGDALGGLALAQSTPLFLDGVDGAAVNTRLWTQSLTTMTVSQAMRLVTMNSGSSAALSAVAIHTSLKTFAKVRGVPLRFNKRLRFSWRASGAVMEVGFGAPSGTTAAIPNGVFLRVLSDGSIKFGYAYNSTEDLTGSIGTIGSNPTGTPGIIDPAHYYDVDIIVYDDKARVVVQRSDAASPTVTEAPAIDAEYRFAKGTIAEWNAAAVPAFARIYNSTAPSTASQLLYSSVGVSQYDQTPKAIPDAMASSGRGFVWHPASGAQLGNYANTAAPGAAALSNTTPSYTTLGGQWQFAAVAGAETDYALFGFVVPTGRTLNVKGVRISAFNMGAAVATTPTTLQWAIGQAAAATIATNSFRMTLGAMSIPIGGAVGQCFDRDVVWQGSAPMVIESGQTFHVIMKIPAGTATASQIVRGVVAVDGWFD